MQSDQRKFSDPVSEWNMNDLNWNKELRKYYPVQEPKRTRQSSVTSFKKQVILTKSLKVWSVSNPGE